MNLSRIESFLDCHVDEANGETSTVVERRGLTTDEGMAELGQRVVRIRKEKGITQVELAESLGVSQPIVSRMEQGGQRLHGELIVQLAKIFGVTTDELLGARNGKPKNQPVPRRWLRRLKKIDQLSKRDQDGLIQTVDRYIKAAEK